MSASPIDLPSPRLRRGCAVFNNDRKIGLIEQTAHSLQYALGSIRMPERSARIHGLIDRFAQAPPIDRDPCPTRSRSVLYAANIGDGNGYRYREVVQSDKGIWVYSAFWRGWQRCVRPHLRC